MRPGCSPLGKNATKKSLFTWNSANIFGLRNTEHTRWGPSFLYPLWESSFLSLFSYFFLKSRKASIIICFASWISRFPSQDSQSLAFAAVVYRRQSTCSRSAHGTASLSCCFRPQARGYRGSSILRSSYILKTIWSVVLRKRNVYLHSELVVILN